MTAPTEEQSIALLSAQDLVPSVEEHERSSPQRRTSLLTSSDPISVEITFAEGPPLGFTLWGSGWEPPRLWRIVHVLQDLARLGPGWDSYSGKPLSRRAVWRVIHQLLFPILLDEARPEPTIVPMRNGGLQFEWHRAGVDVEIAVPPTGPLEYLVSDSGQGIEREGENLDLELIDSALNRMARATA